MDRGQSRRHPRHEFFARSSGLRKVSAQGCVHDEIDGNSIRASMGPETMMEPFNSLRAPVFAKNGLACSSQPLAAALGGEILRAGGNAADAAVAMAAMVNIT